MNSVLEMFHGSNTPITAIRGDGVFGGLFASASAGAARSHGEVLYRIDSPRHLSDFDLNYSIEGAYEAALELADGDERVADAIMSVGCESLDDCDPEDAAAQGWGLQRLRGQLAAKLGFTSVEMLDEHGTTYLCLPGCRIERVA
ncbi:MAG TPA: hypothetical protein VF291_03500 [Burkholderiaceae bacterium]